MTTSKDIPRLSADDVADGYSVTPGAGAIAQDFPRNLSLLERCQCSDVHMCAPCVGEIERSAKLDAQENCQCTTCKDMPRTTPGCYCNHIHMCEPCKEIARATRARHSQTLLEIDAEGVSQALKLHQQMRRLMVDINVRRMRLPLDLKPASIVNGEFRRPPAPAGFLASLVLMVCASLMFLFAITARAEAGTLDLEVSVGANVTQYLSGAGRFNDGVAYDGGFAGPRDTIEFALVWRSLDKRWFVKLSHISHISAGPPFNSSPEDFLERLEFGYRWRLSGAR